MLRATQVQVYFLDWVLPGLTRTSNQKWDSVRLSVEQCTQLRAEKIAKSTSSSEITKEMFTFPSSLEPGSSKLNKHEKPGRTFMETFRTAESTGNENEPGPGLVCDAK